MLTVLFWLVLPIVLLVISNVFMTFAWYDHLKTKHETSMWFAVLVSWGIAFFEYCFQVPANRLGAEVGYTLPQLKISQEVITLAVFCVYAVWRHGEVLRWNHFAAFACLLLAVIFVFAWGAEQEAGKPEGNMAVVDSAEKQS